jgi:hypothetical protein
MRNAVDILRQNMVKYGPYLFTNQVKLVTRSETVSLVNGTPSRVTQDTVHWEGKASLQYVRPTGNNFIVREMDGTIEDTVSFLAYLPYDASPDEGMLLVDVDGVLGRANAYYTQKRRPADVGGVNAYWEAYLGFGPDD